MSFSVRWVISDAPPNLHYFFPLLEEHPSSGTEAWPRPQGLSRFVSAILFLSPAISEHIAAPVFSPPFLQLIYFLVFSQQFFQTLSLSTGLISLLFLSSGAGVSQGPAGGLPHLVGGKQPCSPAHTPAPSHNWTCHHSARLFFVVVFKLLLFFPERIHHSPNHPHSLTIPVIKISQSPEHKPSINFADMFSMLQTQQALSRSSRRCTGSWLRAADPANISEGRALNREWGISGLPWKCEVPKWHLTLTQLSSPISNPSQSLFESLLLDPSIANFFGSVVMTSI